MKAKYANRFRKALEKLSGELVNRSDELLECRSEDRAAILKETELIVKCCKYLVAIVEGVSDDIDKAPVTVRFAEGCDKWAM